MKRLLVAALVLTLGGGAASVLFVLGKAQPQLKIAGYAVSIASMLACIGVAASGVMRAFRDDAALVATEDGVKVERGDQATEIRWDEMEKVDVEPPGTLVFRRRDAEPVRVAEAWSGVAPEALATELEELRRKSAFRLLGKKG